MGKRWQTKRTLVGRQELTGQLQVADEDLPLCVWHQCCQRDATSVGANVILAAGVCVGGMGLFASIWGGPALGTISSFATGGVCKETVLKTVSNCGMQLFWVATVASPESHPKQNLHFQQALPGGRAGWLGCSNLFK